MSIEENKTLPVLSVQVWRDLEAISPKAVTETIESLSKKGSTASLQNAIEAGCAAGRDHYGRAEAVISAYIKEAGISLMVVTDWIDAYINGPMNDAGVRLPPIEADRLLFDSLSLAAGQTGEHAFALVEKLVERGADTGLRDQKNVSARSRVNLSGLLNAVTKNNLQAVELLIGRDTIYDAEHPLPFLSDSSDDILAFAAGKLAFKPEQGSELFKTIAAHFAYDYEQPYHNLFKHYLDERFDTTGSASTALSFARSLLLGVRPDPAHEESSWRRVFDLRICAPSAYPGSDKEQIMPLVHALIGGQGDHDLAPILWHLHKHGLDKEQGCGSANVTPLVHAAAKGKKVAVETLLEMGADTSVKVVAFDRNDPSRWLTPAEVAIACGHEEIARMILSHAAKKAIHDVVMKNEAGRSWP